MDSEDKEFDAEIDSDCDSAYTEDYETEYPPTSACDDSGMSNPQTHLHSSINGHLTDRDVDTEFLHIHETVHVPLSDDGGLEHAEISNCENHNSE